MPILHGRDDAMRHGCRCSASACTLLCRLMRLWEPGCRQPRHGTFEGIAHCTHPADRSDHRSFVSSLMICCHSAGLEWSTGVKTRVALNAAQYEFGGLGCGLCIMFRQVSVWLCCCADTRHGSILITARCQLARMHSALLATPEPEAIAVLQGHWLRPRHHAYQSNLADGIGHKQVRTVSFLRMLYTWRSHRTKSCMRMLTVTVPC